MNSTSLDSFCNACRGGGRDRKAINKQREDDFQGTFTALNGSLKRFMGDFSCTFIALTGSLTRFTDGF